MKKKQLVLIIFIFIFLTIGITSIFHFYYTTLDIKELPMMVRVSDKLGIDVGTDMIRFGGLRPGGGSKRIFHLTNNHDIKVLIQFIPMGDIGDLVSISENNFIIQPEEHKTVDIGIGIPQDMPYGNYTGKLKVIIKRVN